MTPFGPPKNGEYPKQWKEFSLEYKLLFIYQGCMMLLMLSGEALSVRQELGFAATLFLVLTAVAIRRRRSVGWKWRGVRPKDLLTITGGLVLTGIFLYSATPSFPPSNSRFLPWYLAGVGIGVFGILQVLHLVHLSEAAFLSDCRESNSPPEEVIQAEQAVPYWHRLTRAIYTLLFLLVFVGFCTFFFYSGSTFRDGSPAPTSTQTEPLTEHRITVYVTPAEKDLRSQLELFALGGIPLVMVTGCIVHFLVGVKLFPNTPTLREYLAERSSKS